MGVIQVLQIVLQSAQVDGYSEGQVWNRLRLGNGFD